ncbi:MAG: DUF3276 family protein [Bacteroidia bacterium]|nr:DUF3276 family protein [Bacteroidia bacterium]
MEEQSKKKYNGVFSRKLRAGKRRTYFFDVRSTKYDDYYITITESKRRFDQGGYDSHKVFLYKEDFNKFLAALQETVDHVKHELMPDYNYEEFDRPAEDVTVPEGEVEKSETSVPPPAEKTESSEETEEVPAEATEETESANDSTPASDEEAMKWE